MTNQGLFDRNSPVEFEISFSSYILAVRFITFFFTDLISGYIECFQNLRSHTFGVGSYYLPPWTLRIKSERIIGKMTVLVNIFLLYFIFFDQKIIHVR